jgi:Tfp pilus assembly protein PilX
VTRRRRRVLTQAAGSDGAALVLALLALVGLTVITLALLSIAAIEPQVARNHVDAVRARYLAETGFAYAYDMLVLSAGRWSDHLAGATCTAGAVFLDAPLPDQPRAAGHYTVRLRNDCAPGDERLTGAPRDDDGDPTRDVNGKIIVVSTGIVARITKTISAVVSDERPARDPGQTVPRRLVRTYNWAED